MFSLSLFGGARLHGEDGPVTGPASQRHRLALLALLAGHPAGLSRDKLLAFLWPDRDNEHARSLLKQAVHALRKALGDEAILAAGDVLRLNPQVIRVDVVEFEAALAQGDAVRAVALHAGPFLDGFFLDNAAEFERWVQQERQQHGWAYGRALESLAVASEREGDALGALGWWRARAAHEPYDSRIALRLIQALEMSGNRAGALQHAAVHERMLQEEFGVGLPADFSKAVDGLRNSPGTEERTHESRAFIDHEIPPPPNPHVESQLQEAPTQFAPRQPCAKVESPTSVGSAVRSAAKGLRAAPVALVLAITLGSVSFYGLGRSPAVSRSDIGPEDIGMAAVENSVASAPTDGPPIRTIAVLPFVNVSGNPEEEYFSDGLTDEMINTLSQVHALRVVARTSAFAFKGERRDIRDIGRLLGAGSVLEGSVLRDGPRIRVTARLINAADGYHLWSESYQREGTDFFAIQSDLALRITAALEAALTPMEQTLLARRSTESAEANELYLKGRYFWYQRTSGGFSQAIDYFRRAIAVDSQYARAYAGLATVYLLQGISGELTPSEAGERTRAAALEALEFDDELAEAHAALGGYYEAYAWNAAAAEREWRRAIDLDPNYPTVRHFYGNLLAATGRFDEAIAQKRIAVELDPLSPVFSEALGNTLRRGRRPHEALKELRNAIELDSTYWRAHVQLGAVYEMLASYEEALRAHQRAVELAGPNVDGRFARVGLARALALAGREADARRILAELRAEADRAGFHRPHVATAFLALDEFDGALDWLEQSEREGNKEIGARALGTLMDPLFDPVRHEPRFLNLLRRIGLPP